MSTVHVFSTVEQYTSTYVLIKTAMNLVISERLNMQASLSIQYTIELNCPLTMRHCLVAL